MATTSAHRRLMRDYKSLQKDPPNGASAAPTDDNLFYWNAIIFGPEGTPYEDGTFKLVFRFPQDYPIRPPVVQFTSVIFHPNVYHSGNICLDVLKSRWSPSYEVSSLLQCILSLLNNPNPASPANGVAATLYTQNRHEYNLRVRDCVEQSWVD